jgi:hypothetical protein
MSTILKVRSVLMITLNILIVSIFCVAGQMLLNEASFNRRNQLSHIYPLIFQTTKIFDTLSSCSWYKWNAENKKMLLVFLSNSLKSLGFSFAGAVLDLPIGRIGRGLGAADFRGRKEYYITNKTCARHQGRERPMSVRCP